ncbi:MAG: hypothetical protein JWM89_898 [Acidimicrobiales bacterium]|nr:hypothetical protein [Acidimicrobiales bacterium]
MALERTLHRALRRHPLGRACVGQFARVPGLVSVSRRHLLHRWAALRLGSAGAVADHRIAGSDHDPSSDGTGLVWADDPIRHGRATELIAPSRRISPGASAVKLCDRGAALGPRRATQRRPRYAVSSDGIERQ